MIGLQLALKIMFSEEDTPQEEAAQLAEDYTDLFGKYVQLLDAAETVTIQQSFEDKVYSLSDLEDSVEKCKEDTSALRASLTLGDAAIAFYLEGQLKARRLTQVLRDSSIEDQEPLGADFQKVIDDNFEELI